MNTVQITLQEEVLLISVLSQNIERWASYIADTNAGKLSLSKDTTTWLQTQITDAKVLLEKIQKRNG